MGLGPGSVCEFEDDTGLFHWLERDLLWTAVNSDWPTWGKTRAHVKVEHTSIVPWHLCRSSRRAAVQLFSGRACLNTSFQKKLTSREPERVRHLVVFLQVGMLKWMLQGNLAFNLSNHLCEGHKWPHFQWDLTRRYWTLVAPRSIRSYLEIPSSSTDCTYCLGEEKLRQTDRKSVV